MVDAQAPTTEPTSIAVENGRIRSVGDAVPDGALVNDLGGRFVAPGLVTVHTHLSIAFPFNDTDENDSPALTAFRSAARPARLVRRSSHPRGRPGGRALSAPGGHGQGSGSVYCSGPAEFEAAAHVELENGADHVKIFITRGLAHAGERPEDPEMSEAEMRAVVHAAQAHDTYVVAHAGHHAAIRQAIDAGVRSFEHACVVDEPTAKLLAQPGLHVSPTLAVTRSQD